MSSARVKAPTRMRALVHRKTYHQPPKYSKVLAERNPVVAAVGAWVEGGQEFPEHPAVVALATEVVQAEKRREDEENLQRFQDEVRHRLALQAQFSKRSQHPERHVEMTPDRRNSVQCFESWPPFEPADALPDAEQRVMERSSLGSTGDMRHVRLRLAACRVSPHEDRVSNLPGGEWNVSAARHQDEREQGDASFISGLHECLLVQQKASGHELWETDKSPHDLSFKSCHGVPPVRWPLADQEELKRQRQFQFLTHRRLVMSSEREQVKENKERRKHLRRTASIKAKKEQMRVEGERRLEEARQLQETRRKLEEREWLILEQLRLEEEEKTKELQRTNRLLKGKEARRYVEALRAQLKERQSKAKLDLPPLCCCASSFWDSHPDSCANNCVFHNNPKAYAQALHSTMVSLDLQ